MMKNKKATRALTSEISKKICPKSKRSISTIIASLILILLSLTAVSIIWITVRGLTDSIALSPEMSCFSTKINPPIKINSACYDSENNQIKIELERNLENLQINSIYLESNTGSAWQCISTCGSCIILDQGETKTYFLEENIKPEDITLKIENCVLETKNIKVC